MRADNEFLLVLASKLTEIAENCSDVGTQEELNNFAEAALASINMTVCI